MANEQFLERKELPQTPLEFFDFYSAKGLEVIPINPYEKSPMIKRWNKEYDYNLCRKIIKDTKGCNLGLRLGNIIDIEGDTEKANSLLDRVFGKFEHSFFSSSKSTHHLFLNPDKKLTHFRFMDIEFRGYKHQSVLPPSKHLDGTVYYWESFSFPITKMPKEVEEFYWQCKKKQTYVEKDFLNKICTKCSKSSIVHKKRYAREVKAFNFKGTPWICRKCDSEGIRRLCKRFR